MTTSEARARRKELAGPKLSREERKAERTERRARMDDRRAKMMAGEEAYLLPRDQGPVRAYVRDIVDARRNLLGLFMPSALFMIFVMLGVPQLQYYVSPAMLVLMLVMAIDALLLARKVRNKRTSSSRATPRVPETGNIRGRPGLPAAPDACLAAPGRPGATID
jgi:hypothetical protein